MQQLVYVIYFNLKIAAPVEMFLLEFQKLIEFRSLNIDSIVQTWNPEFKLSEWMTGVKERVVSEDQGNSFINQIQVQILVLGIFSVFMAVLFMVGRCFSHKIKVKFEQTKKKTFFNGLIISFQIKCFMDCIVVGNQVRMLSTGSQFIKQHEVISACLVFLITVGIIATMIWYIFTRIHKIDTPEVEEKCGSMILQPVSSSDQPLVYKVPLSALQRLLYILLACGLFNQNCLSLQLFIFSNLFYTIFCVKYRFKAGNLQRGSILF